MKPLKTLFLICFVTLMVSCSNDDEKSSVQTMNLRIENIGTDTIEKLEIETVDQTITLNQLVANTPTNYYLISNQNINSSFSISIENTSGAIIILQNTFAGLGDYKLDVAVTSDLSNTSVILNQE